MKDLSGPIGPKHVLVPLGGSIRTPYNVWANDVPDVHRPLEPIKWFSNGLGYGHARIISRLRVAEAALSVEEAGGPGELLATGARLNQVEHVEMVPSGSDTATTKGALKGRHAELSTLND